MLHEINEKMKRRERTGNLRKLSIPNKMVDLASNDYLGLACLIGSTGSRLLTGNSEFAEKLETEIAAFHGFEASLLYNCGYMANLGLVSAIAGAEDLILYDSHIHASTRAGISLSHSTAFPFRHNNLNHLESRLKMKGLKRDCYVCVESIYSTDGSMAPLKDLVSLLRQYNAHLIVDEAHAIGVRGPQGRGVVAELGFENDVTAVVVTFGKALGAMGAAVLSGSQLKNALINFSEPFIYTTALPYPILKMIRNSYAIFPQMDRERDHLESLIKTFRNVFSTNSYTAIQSLPISGIREVKAIQQHCHAHGIDVRALTSPTVRQGYEKLRICLHAFNSTEQIIKLKEILE